MQTSLVVMTSCWRTYVPEIPDSATPKDFNSFRCTLKKFQKHVKSSGPNNSRSQRNTRCTLAARDSGPHGTTALGLLAVGRVFVHHNVTRVSLSLSLFALHRCNAMLISSSSLCRLLTFPQCHALYSQYLTPRPSSCADESGRHIDMCPLPGGAGL